MKRRDFISSLSVGAGTVSAGLSDTNFKFLTEAGETAAIPAGADLVIAGGGLGGVAASIAALRNNLKVILIEETDWIGGQLTSQGVPPDEHPWIETHGAPLSYRQLRNGIRDYYKRNYPLTDEARNRQHLNPGDGAVSRLCHEPKVALAVMLEMLAPYISTGRMTILTEHKPIEAKVSGNTISMLTVKDLRTGSLKKFSAPYFVDATETGDLLPLTGTEYVTGTESRTQTGELHAPDKADPLNNQSFTICFAMDHVQGQDHVIDKPFDYNAWKQYVPALKPAWPGKLLSLTYTHPSSLQPKTLGFHPEGIATGEALNLWNYRRIINRQNFIKGVYQGDISVVNWPQNDYMRGNIIGVSDKEFQEHIHRAKQLSLSLLYWLQTEVPRPDGGKGWRGLRLRGDIMGTRDGLAKYPYVRESRRIKARFTILEKHST